MSSALRTGAITNTRPPFEAVSCDRAEVRSIQTRDFRRAYDVAAVLMTSENCILKAWGHALRFLMSRWPWLAFLHSFRQAAGRSGFYLGKRTPQRDHMREFRYRRSLSLQMLVNELRLFERL